MSVFEFLLHTDIWRERVSRLKQALWDSERRALVGGVTATLRQ